jgi:hypothetical protein
MVLRRFPYSVLYIDNADAARTRRVMHAARDITFEPSRAEGVANRLDRAVARRRDDSAAPEVCPWQARPRP